LSFDAWNVLINNFILMTLYAADQSVLANTIAPIHQLLREIQQSVGEIQQSVAKFQQSVAETQQSVAETQQSVAEIQQSVTQIPQIQQGITLLQATQANMDIRRHNTKSQSANPHAPFQALQVTNVGGPHAVGTVAGVGIAQGLGVFPANGSELAAMTDQQIDVP